MEKINYTFEEYKILKDEVKSLTDHGFRDMQILMGILAISFGVLNSEHYEQIKGIGYSVLQVSLFIFLVTQCSKLSYILIIREHLVKLENILVEEDTDNIKNKLRWESEVIMNKFLGLKIPSTTAQFIVGISYYIFFFTLCYLSFITIEIKDFYSQLYLVAMILEILTLLYLTYLVYIQFIKTISINKTR